VVALEARVEVDGEVLRGAAVDAAVSIELLSSLSQLLPLMGVPAAGGRADELAPSRAASAARAAGSLAAVEAASS
jgi:hypothetical protein